MSLYIHQIEKDFAGCTPEARFILEALLVFNLHFQKNLVPKNAVALKSVLGVSYKIASNALSELESLGLVVSNKISLKGFGRPVVTYFVADSILSFLAANKIRYANHAKILIRIFSSSDLICETSSNMQSVKSSAVSVAKKNVSSPGGAKGRLSACNRLLLGTFLSYADRVGFVDSLGTSDLITLTGLDEESLKHRKKRLIDLNLIQGFVPGSSDAIFSSKPVTVYLISLSTISDLLFLKHEIKAYIYFFDRLRFGKVKRYPSTFDESQRAYIESLFKGLRKETIQCIKVALLRCVASEVVRRGKESELNAISEGQSMRGGEECKEVRAFVESWIGMRASSDRPVVVNYFYDLILELIGKVGSRVGIGGDGLVESFGFFPGENNYCLGIAIIVNTQK